MLPPPQIRIGTAGWSYKDWGGVVYPQSTGSKFDPLAYLANYFDTIPLHSLRNVIAAASKISEHVLDLLFFVLETLIWRPYYIPNSGVGLPQLNFDAPRLLCRRS